MIIEPLKAFVEKADEDVVRLNVADRGLVAAIKTLGFVATLEPGIFTLRVADDAEKAKVFEDLRSLGVPFSNGKEWCPAEVFEYLRDLNLLSGTFVRVSWTGSGAYRLVDV